jgi:hypothetical protein
MKENYPNTPVNRGLQHLENAYIIPAPCIISHDKIVEVQGIYDLVDFLDNGEIVAKKVKFFDAYVIGYKVTIVILDTKTGELLKRSHRLNNASIPCDWVLTDLFYRMPESKEQLLFDSRDPD